MSNRLSAALHKSEDWLVLRLEVTVFRKTLPTTLLTGRTRQMRSDRRLRITASLRTLDPRSESRNQQLPYGKEDEG
jgi:hypothetical protein